MAASAWEGHGKKEIQQLDSERSQCDTSPIPTPVSPISSQMLRPVEESPELYTLAFQLQSPTEQWPHDYNVTHKITASCKDEAGCLKKKGKKNCDRCNLFPNPNSHPYSNPFFPLA